ncbi:hypothetical protein IWX90DRAFT_505234 [Phyllosticta citrichinensis]|uniref:Uncharacterized protein n=1 Tax=Phyllosticta citrichinensis TaxID=1130410 RepID=A0ABR1XRI2_9PEZI
MASMPTPTSCPNFEEHHSNRQSAAEEFREVVSSEPSASDTKALEAHLRKQFHSAEKLIHLLHIEIDDRREINELDIEKIWYLSDAIAGTIQLLDELVKDSENIKQFLERHRELARRHYKKEARSIRWKACRDAVFEFCGLTAFIADVKTKMGKEDETKDKGRISVQDEYSVKFDTAAEYGTNNLAAEHGTNNLGASRNIHANNENLNSRDPVYNHALHFPDKLNHNCENQTSTNTCEGLVKRDTVPSSSSGRANEFDRALQVINKSAIQIARHHGELKKKLADLTAGKWQVGFRKDLRERGDMPFSPA